jgi:hypothetical protein
MAERESDESAAKPERHPRRFGARPPVRRSCPFCAMVMTRHCDHPECGWEKCRCGSLYDPRRDLAVPRPARR